MSLKIGWDIDGVGYDFPAALKFFAEHYQGVDPETMPLPARSWDWWESQWGWSKDQFRLIHRLGIASGVLYQVSGVMEGFKEGLYRVRRAGGTNHLITARPALTEPLVAAQAARWLRTNELDGLVDSVSFSGDKSIIKWDAYLDDHLPTVEGLREQGLPAFLLDAPYNRANYVGHPEWRITSIDKFLSWAGVK